MTDQQIGPQLAVAATSSLLQDRAADYAHRLALPLLDPGVEPACVDVYPFLLQVGEEGLSIQQTGSKAPGPVRVDFGGGAVAHRRKFGGGSGQQIAKAIGIKGSIRPSVADVTAGLGRDGFVLATLGCEVTLVERSPVVACLLEDGLQRAQQDPELAAIVARMTFNAGQGGDFLKSCIERDARPDVVYLDPMFPHSNKSAEVKKEMKLFRQFIGDDLDTAELLEAALSCAVYRVVVKRPRKAPCIDGPAPTYKLEGKSGRFDIYALKKLQ